MSREPFGHLMIGASAGSGKTHRLTNRYLGLLAAGVKPDAILATTFTRKAAGEILDRVLARLAEAAGDPKAAKELLEQVAASNGVQPDFVPLLRAMLRSLHRVRIGTLDSFYVALAGSFHFEFGLPAGWSIGEEVDDAALRDEALERLLEQHPEDIGKLLPLLTKGELKRSVQGELQRVVHDFYGNFRSSERAAWEALPIPAQVAAAELTAALEGLHAFDFSPCGHKGFATARDKDVARFAQQDWKGFLSSGLAGKKTYYKKPVPEICQVLYRTLLQHAQSAMLRMLAEQTRATWHLLDRFHQALWPLKQTTGKLRFDEVTQALADAFHRQALPADALAFRLDGAVDHLLLDEFQDTSLAQWRVLEPIAQGITKHAAQPARSFFCVGDVKQAIYCWRGGMADIFKKLPDFLGPLHHDPLSETRRCTQPVVDVINQAFGNLSHFRPGDKQQAGLEAWGNRFEQHVTTRKQEPGYVCLQSGPAQVDDDSLATHRAQHCKFVAQQMRELFGQTPKHSIGVLCRKNDIVARMIYELRQLGIAASEEGGKPLTDSAAVDVLLSLYTLADHPGHSAAWFHLRNSPWPAELRLPIDADAFSARLRHELLTLGYGDFAHAWARQLASACDRRELTRLQQLVEMAYGFQSRSTLRADDFVRWVRKQKVLDPTAADVRVMTIHAAKGLEFDVVVLPELDAPLLGRSPSFVVDRDPATLAVNFVCRYAEESVQELLAPAQRNAFHVDRQQRVEESLSLLYVAMTRAIHGLYMFVPGPRERSMRDSWSNLLLQILAKVDAPKENVRMFEHGDAAWSSKVAAIPRTKNSAAADRAGPIEFQPATTERRRGLEHVAPSRREGQARVPLRKLFDSAAGGSTAAGTLYHAWFATVGWLDDGLPTEAVLQAAAAKIRKDLPPEIWRDLDRLQAEFLTWLQNPAINGLLRRSAYLDPRQPAFPSALAPIWAKTMAPQKIERERRFLVRDGVTFWNGSFDRVVWLGDGERTIAADVIDFKTDALPPNDSSALAARIEHYRPQIDAYRRVITLMLDLPAERVAARLVFPVIGRFVEV